MKKTTKFAPNLHLKRARVQRGWSQEYVAREVSTDAFTVSRWERGVAMANPHFRQQLCTHFGLSIAQLGLVPAEMETPDDQATGQPGEMPTHHPLFSTLLFLHRLAIVLLDVMTCFASSSSDC